MASTGNTELKKGIPILKDAFVVIVKTEWNAHWVNKLEAGCRKILVESGIKYETITVPGAVEIPFIVKRFHEMKGNIKADAFIVLGAVIQGDTPHFDYVCKMVTEGVLHLNLLLDVPTVFGVLTVANENQIKERTGGKHGHKGEEAATTAIKMIDLNRKINNF